MEHESITAVYDPARRAIERRVGRVLRERWRLDRLLGVGGMAAVYEATHRNGKRVAIKVLHVDLARDPSVRNRFLREGYAANRVDHRGAVSVIDDDIMEDGAPFLVMELLRGETLEARRARCGGRIDAGDVLCIIDQVLDVLAAAHEKGVIHRDLKPENIFITSEGSVRVLDFGIARVRELSMSASTATQDNTSMGTPAFMPNEQARALWSEVDARTDIWAVGATMFHVLTGRIVHEGRTVNEQLLSAMTRRAPPIVSVAPDLPLPVASVVDVALAFEKYERWPDARSMQAAVRRAYAAVHDAPISTAPKLVVPSVRDAALDAWREGSESMAPTVRGRTHPSPGARSKAAVAGIALLVVTVALVFASSLRVETRGERAASAVAASVASLADEAAAPLDENAAASAAQPAESSSHMAPPPALSVRTARSVGGAAALSPSLRAPSSTARAKHAPGPMEDSL